MKILKTKIENIRGQQVRIHVIAPTVQVTRRERAGCTPQPSYIHGPWLSGRRQLGFTRSE